MRTPLRAAFRLVLTGCLGLAAFSALVSTGRAADPEKAMPDSTLFFLKVKNVAELRESFKQTGFGQLLADPAMKPLKEDSAVRIEQSSKELKAKLGVSISELLSLPQGVVTIGVVSCKTDPKLPVAFLVSADAGSNAAKMTDVMNKTTDQAKQADAKVGTESFKGLTLHIIQKPADGDKPNPPLIWTNVGTVFHMATDLGALKDVITHADGRNDSLATVDAYIKTKAKLGDAPVLWFLDINKAIKLAVRTFQPGQAGLNLEGILQTTGINGLKAAGGTFSFNSGAYDSVSKLYFLAPAPSLGILKMFSMPPTTLRPEPWVPASAASYYTLSWDLDGAYNALNDLIDQQIQPGMLQALQAQWVGPNGGEPLDLQKDVFGPLGNRVTVISDFKKPVNEDSQRFLFGIAVTDVKKFQASLNKIINITGGAPDKRDFQGTTIYDFKLDGLPGAGGGGDKNPLKDSTVSLAIAKDTLFFASEPALLESVLRGGGNSLVDFPEYLEVAKHFPAKSSSINYARSDEDAKASYESIKSGEFEKQFKDNPKLPDISKLFDKARLPEFSVFAKYLAPGGGWGLMEDDGVTFTNFILKKGNP
jgi:hypothetical protein